MPSTSKKQHNFMAAIAHSPAFAKKVGIPQSVGQDFNKADKGRKFKEGGDTMATKMNPGFMAMMAKKKGKMTDGGDVKKMAMGGMSSPGMMDPGSRFGNGQTPQMPPQASPPMGGAGLYAPMGTGTQAQAQAQPAAMKRGGTVKKMATGGMTNMKMAEGGMTFKKMAMGGTAVKKMATGGMPAALAKHAAKPASTAHAGLKAGGMAKGGSFRASADGIAQRGKTRAQQFKSGGKC